MRRRPATAAVVAVIEPDEVRSRPATIRANANSIAVAVARNTETAVHR